MRDAIIAFAVLVVLMFGGRFLVARRLSSSAPAHVAPANGSFTLRPPRRLRPAVLDLRIRSFARSWEHLAAAARKESGGG